MRGLIPEEMDRDASGRAEELIRGVYLRRVGMIAVQPEEEIRDGLRRIELFHVRKFFGGRPDRWFQEESAWATASVRVERAMVNPRSHPTFQGQWEADALRSRIADMAERLDRMDGDEVDSVIAGFHSQVIVACPELRGPVFREAFTKRCLEIIEEEIALYVGR